MKEYKKANYHTHTYRCNHAVGEDEEYVLKAIENGYDLLGFSDHIMLPWTNNKNYIRAVYSEKEGYIKSIRKLKEKYKDQIDIIVGFECEWHKYFYDYYKSLLETNEVDYLILGNHYMDYDFSTGEFGFAGLPTDTKEYVLRYIETSIEAMKTGLFVMFAHPDFFMSYFFDFDDEIKEKCYEMCRVAKEYNVALEINQGCLINGQKNHYDPYLNENRYRYPYEPFWKIVSEVGNVVVTNTDAHSPNAFSVTRARDEAFELAKKYNIKISTYLKMEK